MNSIFAILFVICMTLLCRWLLTDNDNSQPEPIDGVDGDLNTPKDTRKESESESA